MRKLGTGLEHQRQVFDMRARGASYAAIVSETGLGYNTVRGYVSREAARRRAAPPSALDELLKAQQTIETLKAQIAQIEREQQLTAEPVPDDDVAIRARLADLAQGGGWRKVHILSDEHLGDEDPRALRLNIAISQHLKADVTIHNGDTFDFPTLSDHQHRKEDIGKDAFKLVAPLYQPYIDALYPSPLRVIIGGNHTTGKRLDKIVQQFWMLGDTIMEDYAALVRHNGVLWRNLDELDVWALHVAHGTRSGATAAKLTLEGDFGGFNSLVIGHTHRVNTFFKRVKLPGENRWVVVSAVNAGFAGKNPPAYVKRMKQSIGWIQSSVFALVHLESNTVVQTPLVYHELPGGVLATCIGLDIIEAKI